MIVQKPIDDNYEIGVCLTWLYSVLSQAKEMFAVQVHGFTNILIKPMSAAMGTLNPIPNMAGYISFPSSSG